MVNAKEMALAAAKALDSKKGRDIKVLEIDKISNKVVVNGKDITAKIRKMC